MKRILLGALCGVTFEEDRVIVHGRSGSDLILTEDFYGED